MLDIIKNITNQDKDKLRLLLTTKFKKWSGNKHVYTVRVLEVSS